MDELVWNPAPPGTVMRIVDHFATDAKHRDGLRAPVGRFADHWDSIRMGGEPVLPFGESLLDRVSAQLLPDSDLQHHPAGSAVLGHGRPSDWPV